MGKPGQNGNSPEQNGHSETDKRRESPPLGTPGCGLCGGTGWMAATGDPDWPGYEFVKPCRCRPFAERQSVPPPRQGDRYLSREEVAERFAKLGDAMAGVHSPRDVKELKAYQAKGGRWARNR